MSDYTWAHDEIANKWPAVRAVGPDVSVENALEFIRRTDRSFISCWRTGNARAFQSAYQRLVDLGPDHDQIMKAFYDHADGSREAYETHLRLWQRFEIAFDHVHLQHFHSDWMHCCYVGGPNGLVSPAGKVCISKNFGKWPSVSEVEDDLNLLTNVFPWLTFDLALWDSEDEAEAVERGDAPSMAWHIENGAWRRTSVDQFPLTSITPDSAIDNFLQAMERHASIEERECTFTIEEIDRHWGDQIRAAAAKAKDPSFLPDDAELFEAAASMGRAQLAVSSAEETKS